MEKEFENIENQKDANQEDMHIVESEEIINKPEKLIFDDLTDILNEDQDDTVKILDNIEKESLESIIKPLTEVPIDQNIPENIVVPVNQEPIEFITKARIELKQKESPTQEKEMKSNKRILQGKVSSNKADKTILVLIERHIAHPLYKKYFKRSRKVMAHDPNNDCKTGDTVKVIESRPLSARKRWHLLEIVERAK